MLAVPVASAATVSVGLIDHVTDARLAGVAVFAKEVLADGSEAYMAQGVTNANGVVVFDLPGAGEGRRYVFRAQPFGLWVSSAIVSQPGWYSFRVGQLQVKIIDGQSGAGREAVPVKLKQVSAGGTLTWVMSATSGAGGWVKLDPPGGSNGAYVIETTSPSTGLPVVSDVLKQKVSNRFVIGNIPIAVTLRDAITADPLPGKKIDAVELMTDGTERVVTHLSTDSSGIARFDLDVLGGVRRYVLRAQPYLQSVKSQELRSGGAAVLTAGGLQIQLINGTSGTPHTYGTVELLRLGSDGKTTVEAAVRTDAQGWLKLDPERLGTAVYRLRAISTFDRTSKESDLYSKGGAFVFKVGAGGVIVGLIDHMTDLRLGDIEVHAKELLADGSEHWVAKRVTDASGEARFDLEGLDGARKYVFRVVPYGSSVRSDIVSAPGWVSLRVGTSPLTLSDASTGLFLAAVTITAYEKRPDGSMKWAKQGVTNASGKILFDLEGAGFGTEYILKALNPFGDGKDYQSAVIHWRGPIDFRIDVTSPERLDRSPPLVVINEPSEGDRVGKAGFRLGGTVSDDKSVRELRVLITMPTGATVAKRANVISTAGTWFLDTGTLPEVASGAVSVVVTAVDASFNESEARIALKLAEDITAPVIVVEPFGDGVSVPMQGFVLKGSIVDETLGSTLIARVSGGGLQETLTNISVSQKSGRWALIVAPELRFDGSTIQIDLTATDSSGNSASRALQFVSSDAYGEAWHVLQRATFGASPAEYRDVAPGGRIGSVDAWLAAQLDPGSLTDESWSEHVHQWGDSGMNFATHAIKRGVYSDLGLLEVMTWFWENHFNTFYGAHQNSSFELEENNRFRANAMGNFRALLGLSARSPAMLYTLNGKNNRKGRPNENYARELMELHTMGVDAGYSQADVEAVARAFTGWSVVDGKFAFLANHHDSESKVVISNMLTAGGGESDGDSVLDLLASHPSTARFICRKLIAYFVADSRVSAIESTCIQVFTANQSAPNQMALVVASILSSTEFRSTKYRSVKIKTPLKFVFASVRQFGGLGGGDDLAMELQRQGMPPFLYPVPTGYPEAGAEWLSTSMLQTRSRFADRLLAYTPASNQTVFNLRESLSGEGFETTEGVVGGLLERLLGPTFAQRHVDIAIDVLTEHGTYPFLPWAPDAEPRLRRLGKALMALPDVHFQ